ncbi:hypothetical protein CLAIMM_01415 isoform 1 [Cladophialophora immunda]|nr:hypothetical protein CLAIMM_01415 isoform 1 [Cladophialophora immunda]
MPLAENCKHPCKISIVATERRKRNLKRPHPPRLGTSLFAVSRSLALSLPSFEATLYPTRPLTLSHTCPLIVEMAKLPLAWPDLVLRFFACQTSMNPWDRRCQVLSSQTPALLEALLFLSYIFLPPFPATLL